MPFIVPMLSWLVPAAIAGTETGLQLSGAFQPDTSGQMRAMEQQQEAAAKSQAEQRAQAFRHFAPDVQASTGGALTDRSFASMVAELSGYGGDIGQAQHAIFGESGGLDSGGGLNV